MAAHGRLDLFFGLITPHGLLELTAVFVAAGAGSSSSGPGSTPAPGPAARRWGKRGGSMVTVAMGLVVVLFVSGIVEAFVTPSGLPTWARIGIGFVVVGPVHRATSSTSAVPQRVRARPATSAPGCRRTARPSPAKRAATRR